MWRNSVKKINENSENKNTNHIIINMCSYFFAFLSQFNVKMHSEILIKICYNNNRRQRIENDENKDQ